MIPSSEIQTQSSNPLESMQQGRYELATRQANAEAHDFLKVGTDTAREAAITTVTDSGFWNDRMQLTCGDLIAFDSINLPHNVLSTDPGEQHQEVQNSDIFTMSVKDETVQIQRLGQGAAMRFSIDGHVPDLSTPHVPKAITSLVEKRVSAVPGYGAMAQLRDLWQEQEVLPPVLETEPFPADQDALGTLVLLSEIGVIASRKNNSGELARSIRSGQGAEAIAEDFDSWLDESVVCSEDGQSKTYTWGQGAVKQLIHNKENNTYTIRVTQEPSAGYLETANQSKYESIPFVETECAKKVTETLDQVGLMLHPGVQLDMMRPGGAERYGSVYTQLTREIAKWVDSPDRALVSNLFVPKMPEFSGHKLVSAQDTDNAITAYYAAHPDQTPRDMEDGVRDKLLSAELPQGSESAAAIFSMTQDVIARQQSVEQTSDLPVTTDEISIKDGSCFDVTAYYLNEKTVPVISDEGVPLIKKLGGAPTVLTQAPITFNGIRLPKGALLKYSSDGWAVMRLTPFSFDKADDKLAFGAETSKALEAYGPTVEELGKLSLNGLSSSI